MATPTSPEVFTIPDLLEELSAREKSTTEIREMAEKARLDMHTRLSLGRGYKYLIQPNVEDLAASIVASTMVAYDSRVIAEPENPERRSITIDSPFVAVQAGRLILREDTFRLNFFSELSTRVDDESEEGRVVECWQLGLDQGNIDAVQVTQEDHLGGTVGIWIGDAQTIVLPNTDQIRR